MVFDIIEFKYNEALLQEIQVFDPHSANSQIHHLSNMVSKHTEN